MGRAEKRKNMKRVVKVQKGSTDHWVDKIKEMLATMDLRLGQVQLQLYHCLELHSATGWLSAVTKTTEMLALIFVLKEKETQPTLD